MAQLLSMQERKEKISKAKHKHLLAYSSYSPRTVEEADKLCWRWVAADGDAAHAFVFTLHGFRPEGAGERMSKRTG